jgi:hypothetical protein
LLFFLSLSLTHITSPLVFLFFSGHKQAKRRKRKEKKEHTHTHTNRSTEQTENQKIDRNFCVFFYMLTKKKKKHLRWIVCFSKERKSTHRENYKVLFSCVRVQKKRKERRVERFNPKEQQKKEKQTIKTKVVLFFFFYLRKTKQRKEKAKRNQEHQTHTHTYRMG